MEICTGVGSSTLSKIGNWVWSIAASNINYLLCYDRKVQKLEHLVQELNKKEEDIKREVHAATRNRCIVDADVTRWLTDLNVVYEDAKRLEEQVKGVRRFMGCCWDCFSGYKIGKEVAEKIATANELLKSADFTTYSHEPPPPTIESLFPNRDFRESSSTKSLMDHIWDALNNDFFIIGVYGMGGVGKTTIMKEVAKRAKNEGQYNEVIMVTVSQNQDVKRMQTEIAEQLGLKLTDESERVRGANILERIKGAQKILIILDDLWKFLDISEIGIPSADENKECKVVITTRSRDVCRDMGCKQHIKVKPLLEKESWDLFKSKVGNVLEKIDNLTEVAMDVAKECDGLPLAIITLGRAMRDKDDISTWISVRIELQQSIQTYIRGMEDSVFKCLRLSFDFLRSDEAKLCFLLCSLFPEDWEFYIIDFFRYVVGEGILRHVNSMEEAWNRVCRLLDELKDCCLLLEGMDSEHFKMHDVVRDVAIQISSEKTYGFYCFANKGLRRWPHEIVPVDECQRISFMGNSFDSLPEQPGFLNLRTMILKEAQISTIPDGFFQGMEALLVLDLRSEKVASLPSSFPCLVNLKALFLSRGDENFDVTRLSLIVELKKLEILQLWGFELGTVPMELGNLTSLRCLDLIGCRGTIPRNLISRLSRLEQLYLTDVFSDRQVEDEGSSSAGSCAATFAELASLKYLTTLHVHIQNPDVFLQQQDDLNISPWPALTDFKIAVGILPFSFGTWSYRCSRRCSRSKALSITKSTYKYKWVIDLVTKTEGLCLHNWSGMECLIGGTAEEGFTDVGVGHKLFEVKRLYLQSMPHMRSLCTVRTLPNDILRNLSELEIEECHKLIDVLPTCMLLRTHQLMESLVIWRCDKVEKVLSLNNIVREEEEEEEGLQSAAAAGIVLLPRLGYLSLWFLPELRSVWGDDDDGHVIMLPGSLQNLRELRILGCKRLKDDHILPPILPIPSLRYLDISGCDSLTYVLSWRQAKGLPHLQTLIVYNCERMETLIEAAAATEDDDDEDKSLAASTTVQLLPQLDLVQLVGLPQLTNFCEYVEADFPILRYLEIEGCHSLTYLLSWRQAKGLPHLQSLYVRDCERMETIIKAAAATDDDDEDKSLAATAVQLLPQLDSISLQYLPKMTNFCEYVEDFPSLRKLVIIGCDNLTYLLSWRQAKDLPLLQTLKVKSCERMETVIKDEEDVGASATDKEEEESSSVLPSLTELNLNNLPMLRSFFQGGEQCSKSVLSSFKSLKKLTVLECPKLKKLPLSSSSSVLESLVGDSWEWFEGLEWEEDQSIKERLRPVFQVSSTVCSIHNIFLFPTIFYKIAHFFSSSFFLYVLSWNVHRKA